MKKKILIIDTFVWSHYKANLFNELYKLSSANNLIFNVIYIAQSEKRRNTIGNVDYNLHQYSYKILFNKNIEEINLFLKIIKLLKQILKLKPDVLILPGWNDVSYWFILFYCKAFGIKVGIDIDTTEADRKRNFFKENLKKIFLNLCNIALPKGSKSSYYLEKLGMKKESIFITPFTSDNDFISKKYLEFSDKKGKRKVSIGITKKYNMLYVGRFDKEKNVKIIIEAFHMALNIENKTKEWGIILVGDGYLTGEIKTLVNKFNLNDYVFFCGGKAWRDVYEFYALSDVFILPSISEPWGLVVNEAMLCGLPVIISDKAGSIDLVKSGGNGFIFNPLILKELVNIMLKFIRGEVDIEEMGECSRKIISEYTCNAAAQHMIDGLLYALKGK